MFQSEPEIFQLFFCFYQFSKWQTREEVDAKLQNIMVNICKNAASAAKEYGMEDNLAAGANIAGFLKVANAMMAHGVV